MRLAEAGGAEDQRAPALGDEAQGGQIQDELLGQLGVERPIEVLECPQLRQLGLLEAALEEKIAAARQLVLDEQLQELDVGEVVVDGLLVANRQRRHEAGEAEVAELALEVGVHEIPPAVLAMRAYSLKGRMSSCSWVSRRTGCGERSASCSTRRRRVR